MNVKTADSSNQALKAYYPQPVASEFNFIEAQDALVTLTDWSQKTVHVEQQKKFLELSNRPTIALYMGIPDQLIPVEIKNKKLQPFMLLVKITYQNKKVRRPNEGLRDFPPEETPTPRKSRNIIIAKPLVFSWIMYDRRQFVETI